MNDWDFAIDNARVSPPEYIQLNLFTKQIEKSNRFQQTYALPHMQLLRMKANPSVEVLINMVRVRIEDEARKKKAKIAITTPGVAVADACVC